MVADGPSTRRERAVWATMVSAVPRHDFARVASIGRTLPGAELSTAYGQPALKVGGKMFVCIASHKSAEPNTLAARLAFVERDALIEDARIANVVLLQVIGVRRVLVRLSRIGDEALRDLVTSAYRFVSAARARKSPADKRLRAPGRPRTR